LSALASAAAILDATFRVRLDMRRIELAPSSSIPNSVESPTQRRHPNTALTLKRWFERVWEWGFESLRHHTPFLKFLQLQSILFII